VYINGAQERRPEKVVGNELLLDGKLMIIRRGRSTFRIVEVLNDYEAELQGNLRTL